jgi:hypothetical protein
MDHVDPDASGNSTFGFQLRTVYSGELLRGRFAVETGDQRVQACAPGGVPASCGQDTAFTLRAGWYRTFVCDACTGRRAASAGETPAVMLFCQISISSMWPRAVSTLTWCDCRITSRGCSW